jgi:MYXO-CTERM domain-containing protein
MGLAGTLFWYVAAAACSIVGPNASGAGETAWIAGFALTIILAGLSRRRRRRR